MRILILAIPAAAVWLLPQELNAQAHGPVTEAYVAGATARPVPTRPTLGEILGRIRTLIQAHEQDIAAKQTARAKAVRRRPARQAPKPKDAAGRVSLVWPAELAPAAPPLRNRGMT